MSTASHFLSERRRSRLFTLFCFRVGREYEEAALQDEAEKVAEVEKGIEEAASDAGVFSEGRLLCMVRDK